MATLTVTETIHDVQPGDYVVMVALTDSAGVLHASPNTPVTVPVVGSAPATFDPPSVVVG